MIGRIDGFSENDPEATIRKMQPVKRSVLAPADPSSTDRAVAGRAGQIEVRARQEKSNLKAAVREGQEIDAQGAGAIQTLSDRWPYNPEVLGKAINVVA